MVATHPHRSGVKGGGSEQEVFAFPRYILFGCNFRPFARSNINAQLISGDLVGTVLDKTGAAVPGATIDAVNAETGVKHKSQ
jgi:hypothetical protein